VRTITGAGYRWVGVLDEAGAGEPAVTAIDTPPDAAAPERAPAPRVVSPSSRRAVAIVAALALVLVAAWVLLRDRVPSPAPNAVAEAPLVLVMPASVRDEEATWLRLGIMDLVAKRLGDVGVHTVPSESVVALTKAGNAGTPSDVDELKATTGAATLVTTEIRKSDGRWTVVLTVDGAKPVIARAENADVFAAAEAAVAQVITQRFAAAGAAARAPATPLDALTQQIEAAYLADQYDEARRLVESAPAALRDDPHVRVLLARIDIVQGHFDESLKSLEKLLGEEATRKDPIVEAKAHTLMAGTYLRLNRFAESQAAAHRAVELLQGHPSPMSASDLGAALIARATARSAQDDVENAFADFSAARAALAGSGNVRLEAVADVNYSVMQVDHGRDAEAVAPLVRAADLFHRLGIPSSELTARLNLLLAYVDLQNLDAAAAEEPRVEALAARAADPNVAVLARVVCAQSAATRGAHAKADGYLRAIAGGDPKAADQFGGPIHTVGAEIALARDDFKAAQQEAAHAIDSNWSYEARLEARAWARAWWLLERADRETLPDRGKATAERARVWGDKQTEPVAAVYVALLEAEYAASVSSPQTKARFEAALAAAMRVGAPIDLSAVTTSYAAWLTTERDFARARAVLEKNRQWDATSFPVQIAYARLYRETGDEQGWRAALERAKVYAGERRLPDELTRFAGGTPGS
jgi:tetratricopeptide (TPR) repeat protein